MMPELLLRADRLNSSELRGVNDVLGQMSAQERFGHMLEIFGSENIVSTFVNTDLLPKLAVEVYQNAGINAPVHVLFIDTLLYEQATYNFIAGVVARGKQEGYVVDIVKP